MSSTDHDALRQADPALIPPADTAAADLESSRLGTVQTASLPLLDPGVVIPFVLAGLAAQLSDGSPAGQHRGEDR